ncbi:class I tRNA ligase family protein [Candidatus Saccharibacteria bacterium]|nr:class I tRNA ligase family protein [Candidatus Saccharibacteria bacterium]
MLKIYNTATRKNEPFKPLSETVKIYTCGPTVYSEAHIGNLTAYVYWDLLVRTLRANDFKVQRVLNLTDVGHLVSDADEGQDKLEKGAEREGKTVWEVAEEYIDKFKKDYKALELIEPEIWSRATDYINEDIEAVDLMTKNGFTYETTDGVYYDTSKFDRYADFARLDLEGLQAGARVGFSDEKRNVSDFAVWKFIHEGEKHEMRWDYLGRPGYPGWHLECATIIHKELGEPIDIHTGGIDHIPIHHTNEIAETFAAYGRDLSKYWMHCNFITIDGEKISKSLGNVYSLSDLAERGFSAMDYKMWVLSGHYQGTRNFTFESLEAAKARRLAWRNLIAECYQRNISSEGAFEKILEAVNDNLNTAEAYAIIDNSALSLEDWKRIDELFGLRLIEDSPKISEETYALVLERERARADKDFSRADEIRDRLASQGVTVKDTADGPVWQYI